MLSQPGECEAPQDLHRAKPWAPARATEAHGPESGLKPSLLTSANKNNLGAAATGQPCEPITSSLCHRPGGRGDNHSRTAAERGSHPSGF